MKNREGEILKPWKAVQENPHQRLRMKLEPLLSPRSKGYAARVL